MIIVELEMEKGRKKRYGVAEGGNGRQAALSLTCPRLGPSFRVTSPPHVNALDAAIVVVNPNVRPGPNWTAMERSIMKTRRVVEHVVRENNPAHGERLSCWT